MPAGQGQLPLLVHLLQAGGPLIWVLLGCGVLAAFWGLANLLTKPPKASIVGQLIWSLGPAVLGTMGAISAAAKFRRIAMADEAPKPVEFAQAFGEGLAFGIFGCVWTVIPLLLGVFAVARHLHSQSQATHQTEYH